MAKVRCRPQISHGRSSAIPLPLERGCETVKVWSAWPAAQMPQHLRRREVGLQHVRPRLDGWCVIEAFGRALPALAAATRVWRDFFLNREEVYRYGHDFLREQWANA